MTYMKTLLAGSLVGGYVFYKAAMVTAFTGRLGMPGDISRRLRYTAVRVDAAMSKVICVKT